jgi:hypothetical protein
MAPTGAVVTVVAPMDIEARAKIENVRAQTVLIGVDFSRKIWVLVVGGLARF